jgi:hypothetical protein
VQPDGRDRAEQDRRAPSMRTLVSFVMISLDGYYEGPNGELDWANVDAEYFEFANRQDAAIDTLLFGRAGYEHMAAYWQTATGPDPDIVAFMNACRRSWCPRRSGRRSGTTPPSPQATSPRPSPS